MKNSQNLKFILSKDYNQVVVKNNNSFLKKKFHGKHVSQVQIVLEVSDLKYMLNLGNAKIISASIEDFVSLSSTGILEIILESTVNYTAEYSISISFDSQLIYPTDEKSFQIPKSSKITLQFEIRSSNHDQQKHRATIYLKNSIFEV